MMETKTIDKLNNIPSKIPLPEIRLTEHSEKSAKIAGVFKSCANALLVIMTVTITAFLFKAYFDGQFESPQIFKDYIASFGFFGPIVLTVFQAMQVLIPIFPSFGGYAAGSMMFGTMGGFLCNYIGISLGSLLAFLLARSYGITFVKKLISEEKYNKYSTWVNTKSNYYTLIAICFFLPFAPDDFLCFFSGLCRINFKKFVIITFLAKPWCLLLYSWLFTEFGDYIFSLI